MKSSVPARTRGEKEGGRHVGPCLPSIEIAGAAAQTAQPRVPSSHAGGGLKQGINRCAAQFVIR